MCQLVSRRFICCYLLTESLIEFYLLLPGSGWWSFKKLKYYANGDENGKACDYALVQRKETCDVYVKIFIDDKLDKETTKDANQDRGEFILNYRYSLKIYIYGIYYIYFFQL